MEPGATTAQMLAAGTRAPVRALPQLLLSPTSTGPRVSAKVLALRGGQAPAPLVA